MCPRFWDSPAIASGLAAFDSFRGNKKLHLAGKAIKAKISITNCGTYPDPGGEVFRGFRSLQKTVGNIIKSTFFAIAVAIISCIPLL